MEPVIPELIEIGIDILNPVQPECMDPAAIKRRFGDRLAFWGTVSVQRTMPFGTPDDVRAEVRARIRDVGRGGGLILAPAHVLGPETPWENIVAFFEAADSKPRCRETEMAPTDHRMNPPLKLACLGCGARAQTYTQLAARRPDHFEIVAGADPSPSASRRSAASPAAADFRGFPSAEALLARRQAGGRDDRRHAGQLPLRVSAAARCNSATTCCWKSPSPPASRRCWRSSVWPGRRTGA